MLDDIETLLDHRYVQYDIYVMLEPDKITDIPRWALKRLDMVSLELAAIVQARP